MTLIVVVCRNVIPLLFLGSDAAAHAETVALAATLLLVGATFFIIDGMQGDRGRRAARSQRHPRAAALRGDQLLAGRLQQRLLARIPARLGVFGVWIGFSLGVADFAVLLIWRFHRLTARHLPRVCTDRDRTGRYRSDGRASDDRPPRPARRRHRGYARRAGLRALYAAGRDRRGRAWPGHPDRRHLLAVDTRAPSASRRSARISASAAAARSSIGTTARYRDWKRALVVEALRAGRSRRAGRRPDRRPWRGPPPRRLSRPARTRDVLEVGFAALRAHHWCRSIAARSSRPRSTARSQPPGRSPKRSSPMRKPLDIQVTATEGGLDVDVRGSGPLTATRAGSARAASPSAIAWRA